MFSFQNDKKSINSNSGSENRNNGSLNKGKLFFEEHIASGKKIYALAPLAGFSDAGMRAICTRFGADYTVTEMVSAKGLLYANANTERLLVTMPNEVLKCVQLFGREPDVIAKAVRLPALAQFDVIDFNFGCPMRKIVSNGEGSALMNEPETVYQIIKAAVDNSDGRAVTAKLRAGIDAMHITAPIVAEAVAAAGGTAVTVHGRTREQLYSGLADLDVIKAVKQHVKIPVIANGDIVSKESAQKALEYTGADGVAIGRGAVGRPYVFSEIKGIPYEYSIKEVVREHLNILLTYLPERTCVNDMKKHVVSYVKGVRGAALLRDAVMSATSAEEMLSIIDSIEIQP